MKNANKASTVFELVLKFPERETFLWCALIENTKSTQDISLFLTNVKPRGTTKYIIGK